MAEEREQIIIDVQTNTETTISKMALLKQQIGALRDGLKELNKIKKENGELTEGEAQNYVDMSNSLKVLEDLYRKLGTVAQGEIKAMEEVLQLWGDSINGMRAKLSDMTAIYNNMSKAEREAAGGLELLSHIKSLSDELKSNERAMGNYSRNVGNYKSALEGLLPVTSKFLNLLGNIKDAGLTSVTGLKAAAQGVAGLGKLFLALMGNPIVAAIALIAAAVMKLVEAFKKNDDAMTKLQKAFTIFDPIIQAINVVFDALAEGIATVVGYMADLLKAIYGIIPGFSKSLEEAENLVQAIDDLQEAERQYTVKHSENERDIAKLRDEAKTTTDITVRMLKLKEALDLERLDLVERKRIAEEKYRIAAALAARDADTSDETKDKLAQLKAAVINSETEYFNAHRKLLKEYNSALQESIKGLDAKKQAIALELIIQQELIRQLKLLLQVQLLSMALVGGTSSEFYKQRKAAFDKLETDYKNVSDNITKYQKEAELNRLNSSKASNKLAAQDISSYYSEVTKDTLLEELALETARYEEVKKAAGNNKALLALIEEQHLKNMTAIKEKYENEDTERQKQALTNWYKESVSIVESGLDEQNKAKALALTMQLQEEINALKQKFTDELISEEEYNELLKALNDEQALQLIESETATNNSIIELNELLKELIIANNLEIQNSDLYTADAKLEAERLANAEITRLDNETTLALLNNAKLLEKQKDLDIKKDKLVANEKKALELAKQKALKGTLDTTKNVFTSAAQLAGEESAAGKGLAVAGATIDTYQSATAAYNSMAGIPIVGPALGAAAAAAAIASGIANVKSILAVNEKGESSAPSASSASTPSPNLSSLSSITDSTQAVETLVGDEQIKAQQDTRVYVLESDITSTLNKVSVLESLNSF